MHLAIIDMEIKRTALFQQPVCLLDSRSEKIQIIVKVVGIAPLAQDRSEEHTSELQSHDDLVCRLLLEKKK